MKKSIPLDVSSTLGTVATDKPLEATPYANATGTADKAPVLIAVRSEGTVNAEQFAARMPVAGGQGTEAQARLALNAIAAVLGELVEEYGAITVNTPFGTIQTFIAGTLENAQDTPDPETNFAFLGVIVPEAYRRQFAQMTAYVPAGACPVALKRVRDKATNEKAIHGTDVFYLEGHGMTIGGDGETLELLDAVTREKICEIAVDPDTKSKVQFQCLLVPQTAIEAGLYLLRLTTLADGESTLWPVELKVELVEPVPSPIPEPIVQSASGDVKVMEMEAVETGMAWAIRGLNVGLSDGEEPNGIVSADATIGGKLVDWINGGSPFEATEAYFTVSAAGGLPPAGEYVADLTFHRAGGSEGSEDLVVRNVTITVG